LQKFDFIWGKGLDRYRLIQKLSIYLYSKEENKEILPEQNTQILVRMHEVQVLHLMKILLPTFSGRAEIDLRIFVGWCQGSEPERMALGPKPKEVGKK
jgi:hypothetical protein